MFGTEWEKLELLVIIKPEPGTQDLKVFARLHARIAAKVLGMKGEKGEETLVCTVTNRQTKQELLCVLKWLSSRHRFMFYLKSPAGKRAFPYPYSTLGALFEELYDVLMQLEDH